MELFPGQVLHDIGERNLGVLIRRIGTYDLIESAMERHAFPVDDLSIHQIKACETYAWEIVWSKGGHTVLSETGLINLIKCGAFNIVDGS